MSVLAPSVAALWQLIESYQLDAVALFRSEGLDMHLPIEPGTRIGYHAVDRVRARAAAVVDDPDFGLRIVPFVHPSHLGALGYLWLASSSMRQALSRIHRYMRVLNDHAAFNLAEEDGLVRVRIAVTQDSLNERARDDAQIAFLVTLCRMNLGESFNPRFVAFRHDRPDDLTVYERVFRCPVRFGQEHNGMAIGQEEADRTLSSANPMLAEMNERIVSRRLAALDRENLPNRVRAEIMEQLPTGTITDESVAEALHMTSRTLHRRLKADDASFRGLLSDVRRELAEHYIADETLTLTEITYLLGFAEASSFSRAFRRWTGQSPSAARQAGL